MIGYVKQRTGSYTLGLLLLAVFLVAGVVIVLGFARGLGAGCRAGGSSIAGRRTREQPTEWARAGSGGLSI